MSDGGSGNRTTTTTSMPAWLRPYAEGYLDQAANVASEDYIPYTGQRVADLSPIQTQAIQGLGGLAGGTGSLQAADRQLQQTLQGQFQNPTNNQRTFSGGQFQAPPINTGGQYQFNPIQSGGQFNPFPVESGGRFTSPDVSGGSQFQVGPLDSGGQYQVGQIDPGGRYNFDQIQAGTNQFMGFGPEFQNTLRQGMQDITEQYNLGTSADTNRMFNQAGAFGGSAYQQAVQGNQRALGDSLARFTSGMTQDQFNRSAQLREGDIGRQLQAGQFNVGMGNTAFENAAQRGINVGQFGQQLGNQAFENAAQRGINVGQFGQQLGNQAFENAQQRGLNAAQFNRNANQSAFESAAGRGLQAGQFNQNIRGQSFENAAQRGMQAGQFNANLGNQAFESAAQRGMRGQEFGQTLGNQAFENAAQRGLQSNMFDTSRLSNNWENERNRQMQAASGAGALTGQMGRTYLDALQAGDVERRQMQSLLDSQYGDFREWRQYPQDQLNIFGNAFGNLAGRAGGTQTSQGPGYDPVSQGLGLMMLGNSFGGKGGAGTGVR